MSDEVDIANEAAAVFLTAALQNKRPLAVRDPNFCTCESWVAGQQFCGDSACQPAYENEQRMKHITGKGGIPAR